MQHSINKCGRIQNSKLNMGKILILKIDKHPFIYLSLRSLICRKGIKRTHPRPAARVRLPPNRVGTLTLAQKVSRRFIPRFTPPHHSWSNQPSSTYYLPVAGNAHYLTHVVINVGMSTIVVCDDANEDAIVRGPIVDYDTNLDPIEISETATIVITETQQKTDRRHHRVKGSKNALACNSIRIIRII